MNYISITGEAKDFAFNRDDDFKDDEQVTFTFNNVTESFIKGMYFMIKTYVNDETLILDSNVSLNVANNIFLDQDKIDDESLYSLGDSKTIKDYNKYLRLILHDYRIGIVFEQSSTVYDKSNIFGRYIALIDECGESYSIIQFDDIEFMNGLLTFMKIGSSDTQINFRIDLIYDNEKLCHQYIKHDIKVDYTPVRNILLDIRIFVNDIVGIILEYYPNICEYESSYKTMDRYDYLKYIHCETPCDIGQNICRICSGTDEDLCNFPFKTSVRLEIAN